MTVKVTSKGQVTLPKVVRDLLGIGPGSVIDFLRAPDGRTVLIKVDGAPQPNRRVGGRSRRSSRKGAPGRPLRCRAAGPRSRGLDPDGRSGHQRLDVLDR